MSFSQRLLTWYQQHGRHDLPWQKNVSPYRTWLSEIMLQQTQVATVIPYFEKFINRFPDINSLAKSSQDDVLLHWAGLGYYSRARNLHKAAQIIMQQHGGQFPEQYEEVLALPGIGPSTAGAILAQSLGRRHAILDGNVKRVLARYQAIEGWPGKPAVEKQLWQWSEKYTPEDEVADYTQAIMDLGATVCKRSSPLCDVCPVSGDCQAHQTDRVAELPTRKVKKIIPVRAKRLLIIRNEHGAYLMEKRPPSGIWGGLWSLPELAMEQVISEMVEQNWQLKVKKQKDLPVFRHTFSHFHLDITPCEVEITPEKHYKTFNVKEESRYQWHENIATLALAAPVTAIFKIKQA